MGTNWWDEYYIGSLTSLKRIMITNLRTNRKKENKEKYIYIYRTRQNGEGK